MPPEGNFTLSAPLHSRFPQTMSYFTVLRFVGASTFALVAANIAKTDAHVASSYARKKVEMLFAHLKRIIGLDRLRLRGPLDVAAVFLRVCCDLCHFLFLPLLGPNKGRQEEVTSN